jgi:hypothetical protein
MHTNQAFGEWCRAFPDQAMTLAAIDRLVHHATIFAMNVESYRPQGAREEARWWQAATEPQSRRCVIDARRTATISGQHERQSTRGSPRLSRHIRLRAAHQLGRP